MMRRRIFTVWMFFITGIGVEAVLFDLEVNTNFDWLEDKVITKQKMKYRFSVDITNTGNVGIPDGDFLKWAKNEEIYYRKGDCGSSFHGMPIRGRSKEICLAMCRGSVNPPCVAFLWENNGNCHLKETSCTDIGDPLPANGNADGHFFDLPQEPKRRKRAVLVSSASTKNANESILDRPPRPIRPRPPAPPSSVVKVRRKRAIASVASAPAVRNFDLAFFMSEGNIESAGIGTFNINNFRWSHNGFAVVDTGAMLTNGLLAGRTQTVTGTLNLGINDAGGSCNDIAFFCVYIKRAIAIFDPNLRNNVKCRNVFTQVSCDPDIRLEPYSGLPDASHPFIATQGQRLDVKMTLRNTKTGARNGDSIRPAEGARINFEFSGVYSSSGGENPSTVNGYSLVFDLADSDYKRGIPTDTTIEIKGNVTLPPVKLADCANTKFVCITAGAAPLEKGATFVDTSADNNRRCVQIVRTCRPDPKIDSVSLAPVLAVRRRRSVNGGSPLTGGQVKEIALQVVVSNHGLGEANALPQVRGTTTNFKFAVQLSDKNMGERPDTLGLGRYRTTVHTARLQSDLVQTDERTIAMTAKVLVPSDVCSRVKFVCVILEEGTNQGYIDASVERAPGDIKPNTTCLELTAGLLSCHPDPYVESWTLDLSGPTSNPSDVVFVQNRWTVFKIKDLIIKNKAQGTDSGINPASSGSRNFDFVFKLSNRNTKLQLATANSTEFVYSLDSASRGRRIAQLGPNGQLVFNGEIKMVLVKSICHEVKYACVIMINGPGYKDGDTSNNYKCIDIKKTCQPDINIKDFAMLFIVPVPVPTEDTPVSLRARITIANVAPGLSGNDFLAPPSNPANSVNFKFSLLFSDANLRLGENNTLGLPKIPMLPMLPDGSETLDTLTASTTVVRNVINKKLIAAGACLGIKYLCVLVEEGANANYVDANPWNNVYCLGMTNTPMRIKNCKPVFTNLPNTTSVKENTGADVMVFKVTAIQSDLDYPAALTYEFEAGENYPNFAIQPDGIIKTTSTPLNYEASQQHVLKIVAKDNGQNPGFTSMASLTVNVLDVNEIPFVSPSGVGVTIPENTATPVITMTPSDIDTTPQAYTYSIDISPTLTPAAPFWIDSTGVISLSSPGLNRESPLNPTFVLTVHMTDGGTPPLAARTADVTVICQDVPEQPKILHLPAVIELREDFNNDYATLVYTISATDPDIGGTNDLEYRIVVEPNDGNFIQETGKEYNIQYTDHPTFDFERTPQYNVTVLVRDTATDFVSATLIIKITNNTYGDNPVIDETYWPGAGDTKISESQHQQSEVFQLMATDPDGRPLAYSMSVAPESGTGKFAIDEAGRVYTTTNPGFNKERNPAYTLTLKVCAHANCTSKDLEVTIVDKKDFPACSPSSLSVSVLETVSWSPTKLFSVQDDDASTTFTYSQTSAGREFGARLAIDNTGMISGSGLDYDTIPSQIIGDFVAQDPTNLQCHFNLKVDILDDNVAPVFNPSSYSGSIQESARTGTSILTVTATDADIGHFGNLKFYVDTTDPNSAHNFFQLSAVPGQQQTAILNVQSQIDRDTMATDDVIFKIFAEDTGGLVATATVTVKVTNVNDNRPVFDQDLYNFELDEQSPLDYTVGRVACTDGDVVDNTPTYRRLQELAPASFEVDKTSGSIVTNVNPLASEYNYVFYVECLDSQSGSDMISLTSVVRVDTYKDWKVLTNWTTVHPPSFYYKAQVDAFLKAASSLCTPCVAKLHSIASDSASGGSILTLYFLEDARTDVLGNIGRKKKFYSATFLLSAFTTNHTTPGNLVTSSPVLASQVRFITRYKPEPEVPFNWLLDTIGGHLVLGVLMSLALTLSLTTLMCIMVHCARGRRAIPVTLKDPGAKAKKKGGKITPVETAGSCTSVTVVEETTSRKGRTSLTMKKSRSDKENESKSLGLDGRKDVKQLNESQSKDTPAKSSDVSAKPADNKLKAADEKAADPKKQDGAAKPAGGKHEDTSSKPADSKPKDTPVKMKDAKLKSTEPSPSTSGTGKLEGPSELKTTDPKSKDSATKTTEVNMKDEPGKPAETKAKESKPVEAKGNDVPVKLQDAAAKTKEGTADKPKEVTSKNSPDKGDAPKQSTDKPKVDVPKNSTPERPKEVPGKTDKEKLKGITDKPKEATNKPSAEKPKDAQMQTTVKPSMGSPAKSAQEKPKDPPKQPTSSKPKDVAPKTAQDSKQKDNKTKAGQKEAAAKPDSKTKQAGKVGESKPKTGAVKMEKDPKGMSSAPVKPKPPTKPGGQLK